MVVDSMSDTEQPEKLSTSEWIKKNCPIFSVYADSGEGKTTLISTLFEDDDYWPVLYIDADEGDATIARYTRNKRVCDYRSKSQRGLDETVFDWFAGCLKEARTSKHRAIVIEGITRWREDMVSEFLIDNPGHVSKPRGVQKAYAQPSQLVSAVFGAISKIKDVRKRNGTGVPVIGSYNAKEKVIERRGQANLAFPIPALSPNLIQNIMGRSDVFAELSRTGKVTRLRVNRGTHTNYRKARNPLIANAIADMRSPELPAMFDTWASMEQEQTDETTEWALDDENTVPEDETQDTDED